MQKKRATFALETILPALLVLAAAALAYLPLAGRLGFYNDDWYLMYAGFSQGPSGFIPIFAIDRPLRAYLVGALFTAFGANAPLYSYSAYALRVVAALGAVWLVRLAWPQQKKAAWLVGLLAAVYPGFLDQTNAVDFQSHLVAFALAVFSIALNVRAALHPNRIARAALLLVSAAFQAVYLLLMEYYVGLEGLRFLLLFYVIRPPAPAGWLRRGAAALLRGLPALLTSLAFLYWRLFLFAGQRPSTNTAAMIASLLASTPLRVGWMLANMLRDLPNVLALAWGVPFYQLVSALRLRDLLLVFGLAAAAAALTALAATRLRLTTPEADPAAPGGERSAYRDMIWIGVLAVVVTLIPIHFGQRNVVFPTFSRFTLPGSIGACLALVGALLGWTRGGLRAWLPPALVGLAVATGAANAVNAAGQWQLMKDFWWQVAWRAPQIAPGTVLAASYADVGISEGYQVWGPANLTYYPTQADPAKPRLVLEGITLQRTDLLNVLAGSFTQVDHRGTAAEIDYASTLVFTRPSAGACVQALDGAGPELSIDERSEIRTLAPYSQVQRILADAEPQGAPGLIFGPEPAHTWCYYYEKAALARQRGDWEEVVRLGDEAAGRGLRPNDRVEWMPFLEGYSRLGRADQVSALAVIVKDVPALRVQACRNLAAAPPDPGLEPMRAALCG